MKRDPEMFDSPWAPPEAETLEVRPMPEVYAEGNVVVLRMGCDLPERCVVCNSRDRVRMSRKRLTWHHPAWYLLILINLILYVIVALVIRRSTRIQVGLCEEHRKQRQSRILAGCGVVFLGVLTSVSQFEQGGLMLALAIGFTILAAIFTLYLAQTVYAQRIDREWVRLKGAGSAFLDGLPRARR